MTVPVKNAFGEFDGALLAEVKSNLSLIQRLGRCLDLRPDLNPRESLLSCGCHLIAPLCCVMIGLGGVLSSRGSLTGARYPRLPVKKQPSARSSDTAMPYPQEMSTESASAAPAEAEPKRGGTLRVAVFSERESVPATVRSNFPFLAIRQVRSQTGRRGRVERYREYGLSVMLAAA